MEVLEKRVGQQWYPTLAEYNVHVEIWGIP